MGEVVEFRPQTQDPERGARDEDPDLDEIARLRGRLQIEITSLEADDLLLLARVIAGLRANAGLGG
jgi:hypothetical protein